MTSTSTSQFAAHHFADALKLYMQARRELAVAPFDDDDDSRLCDALSAAEEYVKGHAAPDFAGLLAKFEIATRDNRISDQPWIDSIHADFMRLANLTRSPTFDPVEWMRDFKFRGGAASGKLDGKVWLGCPLEKDQARKMLHDLTDHERDALAEHLRQTLPEIRIEEVG